MTELFYNEDCTQFAYTTPPDAIGVAAIHHLVDGLAEAGVTTFLSNPNGMRINYDGTAREPMWHGYDPARPDDQPILQGMDSARIPGTRRMLDAMIRLVRQGVDFHACAFARCRSHNISPWISLRMNDIHDTTLPDSPLLSNFWKAHPELRRGSAFPTEYFSRALDYAQPLVREHYQALIEEVLTRYDLDGLELDFQREPYLFRNGHEREGGHILTAWLGEVRRLTQEAARRLGHPVHLGVRVPTNPETARLLGLDAVQWAKQGLVDVIVVTPRWATTDFDMPLLLWRELLGPAAVQLLGGMEIRVQPYPDGPVIMQTPETAAGNALNILTRGADGVYLFNFFQNQPLASSDQDGWTPTQFTETLRAMRSMEVLNRLPRRHVLTFRDTRAPGEPPDYPLPATGVHLHFRLPTGPKPVGRRVQITIRVGEDFRGQPPVVRINSVACPAAPHVSGNLLTYDVLADALMDDTQVIEIESGQGKLLPIAGVECSISGT